jgi:hypothetical protein
LFGAPRCDCQQASRRQSHTHLCHARLVDIVAPMSKMC